MTVVLVVELEQPEDDAPDTLAATVRRVSDVLQGLPVRRVWAGIEDVAAAVAGLHEAGPDGDEAVLAAARAVLRRHGHGIGATCSAACRAAS